MLSQKFTIIHDFMKYIQESRDKKEHRIGVVVVE
jgi:hypothetical protein